MNLCNQCFSKMLHMYRFHDLPLYLGIYWRNIHINKVGKLKGNFVLHYTILGNSNEKQSFQIIFNMK